MLRTSLARTNLGMAARYWCVCGHVHRVTGSAANAIAATSSSACGLEDPTSIGLRRGVLNLAFPEALHVGTAVWQAQLAGTLTRDDLLQRDDLAPEARSTLRLFKANAQLRNENSPICAKLTATVSAVLSG